MYSIDVETCDPDLKTLGAGVRREDSFLVGVAIGHHTGGRTYMPYRHAEGTNFSKAEICQALQRVRDSGEVICGANLLYDFDWILEEFGIDFYDQPWHDVQVAEPLLDENKGAYALGQLAADYLGERKSDDDLNAYCAARFGGKATRNEQAKNYWKAPVKIIEPYAKSDVDLPLRIAPLQLERLSAANLTEVFLLESQLQPVLLKMKCKGVRVDVERVLEMRDAMASERDQIIDRLGGVKLFSSKEIAALFDQRGILYPRTKLGAPSFTKEFLASSESGELGDLVREGRHLDKLVGTFLDKSILRNVVRDRVHCQFNQLRGDDYGTVTGRLSSSLPNLQQIPARTTAGKRIRSLYIPDDRCLWHKLDYSQIEPRLLLSYATGTEAQRVIDQYLADPSLDCYNAMMREMPDWLDRNAIKAIHLGATYGMGKALMAQNMGVDMEQAERSFQAFHDGAPYIKKLSWLCEAQAKSKKQIRTIGGRLRRFPDSTFAYKALNALIQGGAADIMKRAIVEGVRAGLTVPGLTVHDELDFGDIDREEAVAWSQVMCEVYSDKLKVKMRVDVESGPSWGEVQ